MNTKETATPKSSDPGKADKLGLGRLLAWSLRNASTGISFLVMGYLMIFCTNTLGIPAKIVGTLLLLSKLLDGVTDIFAGFIVDKTNTKLGRGRPYELCIIGLWAATVALFFCPASLSLPVKCIWIFVAYALANSVFTTFLNANNTVYMIRAFNNPRHYIALSTYGGLIPMVAALVFNILFPQLMARMATSQGGWIRLILICAIPMTAIGMLRFFVIKEVHKVDVKSAEKLSINDVFTVLKNNKFIYAIAFASFVNYLITNMGVNVYYFTDIVGDVGKMGFIAMVQVLAIPMMFILPQVLKRTTAVKVIRVGLIVTILGYVLNFFAGSNFPMLAVAAVMYGAGLVPISMLTQLLIIDCADYNEYKGLYRLEGSLSAVDGFAKKVGAGLGVGILGILLGAAGYDGTLAVQPDSALLMIRMLFSLIPAIMYILVYVAYHFYTLDKLKPEIQKTIAAKNTPDQEQN